MYGRGSSPNHFYKDNDIDQRIPGKWMAQARCRLEVTPLATPKSILPTATELGGYKLNELTTLAKQHNITPTGDLRRWATYTDFQSAPDNPTPSPIDVVVTGWNETKRTVTVQPHGRTDGVEQALTLDHPFYPNPKWKLKPGKWLVGSIIIEQWLKDTHGKEHPPYLGRVKSWDDTQELPAEIEYLNPLHRGEVRRENLEGETTHRYWTLLQTRQHLEQDPHPGFKDRDHSASAIWPCTKPTSTRAWNPTAPSEDQPSHPRRRRC